MAGGYSRLGETGMECGTSGWDCKGGLLDVICYLLMDDLRSIQDASFSMRDTYLPYGVICNRFTYFSQLSVLTCLNQALHTEMRTRT